MTSVAPMRRAESRSCCGGTMRSLTAITHEGRVFQAAAVIRSPRKVEFQSPWVARTISRSATGVRAGREQGGQGERDDRESVWHPVSVGGSRGAASGVQRSPQVGDRLLDGAANSGRVGERVEHGEIVDGLL